MLPSAKCGTKQKGTVKVYRDTIKVPQGAVEDVIEVLRGVGEIESDNEHVSITFNIEDTTLKGLANTVDETLEEVNCYLPTALQVSTATGTVETR